MGVATTKLDYGRIMGRELGIPVVEATTPVSVGGTVLLSLAAMLDHVVPLAGKHKRQDRTLVSFDLFHSGIRVVCGGWDVRRGRRPSNRRRGPFRSCLRHWPGCGSRPSPGRGGCSRRARWTRRYYHFPALRLTAIV